MRKKLKALSAAILAATLFITAAQAEGAEASAFERYLAEGVYPSLKESYRDLFMIGAAVTPELLADQKAADIVAANFNSLTCENEMKPDFTLSWSDTRSQKDEERAVIYPSKAKKVLAFAQEHGIKVRAHTLIWHAQTPRWFFTVGWDKSERAPLVDRDTMIRRMENYIHDMMDWVNSNYPGVVYAWDVVNEAIEVGNRHPEGLRTENNLWYDTVGDDWVELAFTFARKYAAPDQKLFYNDYSCTDSVKFGRIRPLLKKLVELGVIDGLGMQSHLGLDSPTITDLNTYIANYAHLGLTIHITELDIGCEDGSVMGQMKLAVRYRQLFNLYKQLKERAGIDIESITFWGLTDNRSWLNKEGRPQYPLLFNSKYAPKPSFFGVLMDASIPTRASETLLQEAIDKLGLEKLNEQEAASVNVYKTLSQHNPVMVQRFGADPWAMVYGDRVYLYMTGDEPMMTMDGKPKTNDYSNITTLRVLSSDDLVNWQDHGSVAAAGKSGAAKWASNSWAPCAAWKTIDGQDKFFLYFANSGGGIGVLTADSPTGPFTDPLGKALVSRSTPTCASVTWLFDPAVLVDDDGSAYLYFGGGIPDGKAEDPGTARVAKLSSDMISLDGDPVAINPPWLFEDSGINKFRDTYVYSYCSNFNVPGTGSAQGFQSGEIVYMTSDSPMGPFEFGGRVLQNPGAYFGVGGNNHHCMFEFQGKYYITYHAATVDKAMGWNAGYRSTFIDVLKLNEAGLPTLSKGTYEGVEQVKAFDPYAEVPAATLASLAGMETALVNDADKAAGTGNMLVRSTASGGWIGIAGVDFGAEGAGGIKLTCMAEEGAKLEILLDSLDSEPIAVIDLSAAGEASSELFALPGTVTGVHDLYFRFSQPNISLLQWQFFSPLHDQ